MLNTECLFRISRRNFQKSNYSDYSLSDCSRFYIDYSFNKEGKRKCSIELYPSCNIYFYRVFLSRRIKFRDTHINCFNVNCCIHCNDFIVVCGCPLYSCWIITFLQHVTWNNYGCRFLDLFYVYFVILWLKYLDFCWIPYICNVTSWYLHTRWFNKNHGP